MRRRDVQAALALLLVAPWIRPSAHRGRERVRVNDNRRAAGTFIYHTHVDELRRQPAGLAGALVVLELGAVRSRDRPDRIDLIALGVRRRAAGSVLNGSLSPAPLELRLGVPHRVRLINITKARWVCDWSCSAPRVWSCGG